MVYQPRFFRETEEKKASYTGRYTDRYTGIYFKNLTHTIVGADKSEVCRTVRQARNLGSSCCYNLEAESTFPMS
jgi:hypothetical protein